MSYCVHCGVELDDAARRCPLCHTPVLDPNRLQNRETPPSFPQRREEVLPVSKKEAGLLLTAMLLSAAVCCVVLNLFLGRGRAWSPAWSLVVCAICVSLCIPLVIVRWVPSLREEARRRFHI